MRFPFTWRPTGWFMVGWSQEIPAGTVKPLKYFGRHLVAYRTEAGQLVVADAHCPHLGAHLGHGGKVNGECVECPYHGWAYGPDGVNRSIPYEDRPNLTKRLTAWSVVEQHECIYLWHDPAGGPPRWKLPNVFDAFDGASATQRFWQQQTPAGGIGCCQNGWCGGQRRRRVWRPVISGRSRKVLIPGVAAQTWGIAWTACMAVPRTPWSFSSSPWIPISETSDIDGEPSMVTVHPRPFGQSSAWS